MATLAAITFNLVGGMGIFTMTLGAFGCALRRRSTFVAARCEARPRNVIYNPNPSHPSQNRGNSTLGWIFWVMGLTYDTMLRGVPGTGTRDGGLSGMLLRVNLDGIVLLRFHHLCLRVSSLAAVLYVIVALPVYATAQCSRIKGDLDSPECLQSNLTDYQRLTLANIPILVPEEPTENFVDTLRNFFIPQFQGNLARLYAIVFCAWIVTFYALKELEIEWGDILAMRRVYYLEADHFGDRHDEVERLLQKGGGSSTDEKSSSSTSHQTSQSESYITNRQPYVPHPELPDTVPNVELYSLLVGGLPSLPTDVLDQDVEAVFSRKQAIDWQLAVTTAFFDHCVPNQPGFSSSVAAVTILPSSHHLSEAWNQWNKAASKLRRLRFIRREIAKRRRIEEKKNDSTDKSNDSPEEDPEEPPHEMPSAPRRQASLESQAEEKKKIYYQEVLGSNTDLEVENNLLQALNFGPEQTAVYSREFALGAGNLAPNGWFEGKVRRAGMDDLLKMEQQAVQAVHEANQALRKAQERIGENAYADSKSDMDVSDDEMEEIMKTVSAPNKSTTLPTIPQRQSLFGRAGSVFSSDYDDSSDDENSFADGGLSSEFEMPLTGGGTDPTTPERPNTARRPSASSSIDTFSGGASSEGYSSGGSSDLDNTGSRHRRRRRRKVSDRSSSLFTRGRPKSAQDLEAGTPRRPIRSSTAGLGLEAGLWMEQKNLSMGTSQHLPRANKLIAMQSRSSLSVSMHGGATESLGRRSRRPPRRTKSSDDTPLFLDDVDVEPQSAKPLRRAPPRRTRSSDDASHSDSPEDKKMTATSLRMLQESLRQSYRIGGDKEEDAVQEEESENEKDTIWSRLEKDTERKEKLREKLTNMQNQQEKMKSDENRMNEAANDSDAFSSSGIAETTYPRKSDEDIIQKKIGNEDFTHRRSPPNLSPSQSSMNGGYQSVPVLTTGSMKSEVELGAPKQPQRTEDEVDDDDDDDDSLEFHTLQKKSHKTESSSAAASFDNLKFTYTFETAAHLRPDEETNKGLRRRVGEGKTDKWMKVMTIVQESSTDLHRDNERLISSGRWRVPTCSFIIGFILQSIDSFFFSLMSYCSCRRPEMLEDLVRDSTYAVVTFTSRQAAVAARHCLADSRGASRWVTVSDMPSPPLADGPVCNASSFRGCGRPVTMSISDKQKTLRHLVALGILGTIYFFYTIPLVAVQQFVRPESLSNIFPNLPELQENSVFLSNIFSGFIPALVWTGFFAICPPLFKIIANFGSNATSSVKAETSALNYFWWFMFIAAFTGTSFSGAIVNGFNEGLNFGAEIQKVIEQAAATIPTEVSAVWLNWIIVRALVVLPTQYLLQMNTFLFTCLGLTCCARAVRGGGAGGPVPYRIYVDSGVVMLCLFALAPASPIVAPAAFLYFLFCTPLLRWTMIFLYKPKFDIGGQRFDFLFDVCVSGMVMGQVLLIAMMALKAAVGPAFFAFIPMIPTVWFRYFVRRRYIRAFYDAALLQTSLLDGWDVNEESSQDKREKFRQFLVDCHKASYVPVCIMGDQSTVITAEPAVVCPLESDTDFATDLLHDSSNSGTSSWLQKAELSASARSSAAPRHAPIASEQPGQILRRAMVNTPALKQGAMVRAGESANIGNFETELASSTRSEVNPRHPHSPSRHPHSPLRQRNRGHAFVSPHDSWAQGVNGSPIARSFRV